MRHLTALIAAIAAVAATAALAAAPALADPVGNNGQPIVPRPCDVVGVGAAATEFLFDQFSRDYNLQKGGNQSASCAANPTAYLYSWDAGPTPGPIPIVTKKGCPPIPRPGDTAQGLAALPPAMTGGHPCIDFVRADRARLPTDPPTISFVSLADEAVTYATEPGSNAPGTLTTAQLAAIYTCRVTNWSQVGGKNAPVKAYIPMTSSVTRAFFLSSIGVAAPGACVSDVPTPQQPGGTLEEDEGVNPVFKHNPQDIIFPYSVSKYLAERYHSAKCLNAGCTPNGKGIICTPAKGQDLGTCDLHGTMVLNEVNGTAPTVPFPLTSATKNAVINFGFAPTFQRVLYDVVVSSQGTIPAYLKPIFGPAGWICANAAAKTDLRNYGFLALPTGTGAGDCGFAQ
jgi:hypothetical protein